MGALHVLLGLYATVLPFAVVAAWVALALWDLARRDDLGRGATVGWALGVLVVPVVGAVAYLLSSRQLPTSLTGTVVGGGVLAYLLVVVVTAAVGGSG
jgi:hypothetical protein